MSLKSFHLVFITVSALLGLGLLFWGIQGYQGSSLHLGLGLFGLALLAALIPYARWFRKKMSALPTLVLITLFSKPAIVQACAVCFGDPKSPLVRGAKLGIITLILVVGGVLGMISTVAFKWNRRAKAISS